MGNSLKGGRERGKRMVRRLKVARRRTRTSDQEAVGGAKKGYLFF
jgi:hypothetical protein